MKFVTTKSGGQFAWPMDLVVESMNPVLVSSMG
jgi:hypothetical protein